MDITLALEQWYDYEAYEATSGTYKANLWRDVVSALKARALAPNDVANAIDFVVSTVLDEGGASKSSTEVRAIVEAGLTGELKDLVESYARNSAHDVAAMARSYLICEFLDDTYWSDAVSSIRSGSEAAVRDALTIFSRGRAGDEKSRRVVEDAIDDGSVNEDIRETLEHALHRSARYALWRKKFYAGLSDSLGVEVCPLDPYRNARGKEPHSNFTLVTGFGSERLIKVAALDWDAAISIGIAAEGEDTQLGYFVLSDVNGPESAVKCVTDFLASATRVGDDQQ
jgi:hypothetical protein